MTRDEVLNMLAGDEIDSLIAHKIMGYVNGRKDYESENGYKWWTIDIPHYSDDISAAWEVVVEMEDKWFWFELSNVVPGSGDTIVYEAKFSKEGKDSYTCQDKAPLAICISALLAVMESE
jgi:hypothetical protein